jgi:hypothetical protein
MGPGIEAALGCPDPVALCDNRARSSVLAAGPGRSGGGRIANRAGLREHLLELLGGGHAHLDFDRAIAGLPAELRGARPPGLPHSPWRLVEHLRIAHWDILRFSEDAEHVCPAFPAGYWPEGDAPPDPGAWDRSIAAFRADLQPMKALAADPRTDLLAPIPHAQGQTILREALLVADHSAYRAWANS